LSRHERDSKTTKLFHGKAEIENWRQQMGPERWDSISPEIAKEGPQLELPIDPRELAVEAYFAKHSVGRVASTGDATRRTEVSVGVHPSFAKIDAAIQRSNHALSLGDAPSGNSWLDGNGTLRPLSSSDARIILPEKFPIRPA
jgi:hypothetical protein